jgi:Ca-activated chloride channel family protein
VLDDDFRNDDVDAGELGAGHQVTALYELVLWDDVSPADRLGTVSMRWQDPDDGDVVETRLELTGAMVDRSWSDTDTDFRLAVTVGALAEVLRGSPHAEGIDLDDVAREVEALGGSGAIDELAEVVDSARRLS